MSTPEYPWMLTDTSFRTTIFRTSSDYRILTNILVLYLKLWYVLRKIEFELNEFCSRMVLIVNSEVDRFVTSSDYLHIEIVLSDLRGNLDRDCVYLWVNLHRELGVTRCPHYVYWCDYLPCGVRSKASCVFSTPNVRCSGTILCLLRLNIGHCNLKCVSWGLGRLVIVSQGYCNFKRIFISLSRRYCESHVTIVNEWNCST